MPEPDKPIKRMNTVSRRIWFVRERAKARRAEREAVMAVDTKSEKVPLTPAQKKSRWLKVLGIIVFLAAYFLPPQYKPFAPVVHTHPRMVELTTVSTPIATSHTEPGS